MRNKFERGAKHVVSELAFEKEFIDFTSHLGGVKQWKYCPQIKTTDQLWRNLRHIIEDNNTSHLDKPLSDIEFDQIKRQISNLQTPYEAGRWIYGLNGTAEIELNRDDGTSTNLKIFDQSQVGAGNTHYQIVNQIERQAKIPGRKDRRFDVTFLINGLPMIQVEEKRSNESEALNQMQQYIAERQYTDIFATTQLLVALSPHGIRYMANTTLEQFNTAFAFRWQREKDNMPVYDWKEFANQFLNIPTAHYMATSYMILDGTPNHQSLKVMRPYQVYATKAVIKKLRQQEFGLDPQEAGYIWHTTGSGKTISSFKTAWLAQRLPNVDNVVFMVDRIALTNQTLSKYAAYDPDSDENNKDGVVFDTANIGVLKNRLKVAKGITVTSIQKMDRLVSRPSFKAPDKHTVFIVDEAHRSTAGDMLQRIKQAFPKSAWIGYTGTPSFEGITTQKVFGNPLHIYTIREAIADRNVLGFKVDFNTTLSKQQLEKEYLPKFYQDRFPKWTGTDIQTKIDHLTPEDMDDLVKPGVYDNNKQHVALVVKDILDKWRNRSVNGQYSALLTTHVGGNQASTPMAMMYYEEFQKQNKSLEKPLKVAVTFSENTSNNGTMLATNTALLTAMREYSQTFGGHYDGNNVKEYTENVIARLDRSIQDGVYLDLVIVVDQLLTGFDAPTLNTLYVDRTLQGKNLIQAYSRTNRIENMTTKPYGRIVNYRWPALTEKLMNEALAQYANRDSANLQQTVLELQKDGVLAKSHKELVRQAREVVQDLKTITNNVTQVPNSEAKQDHMYHLLQKYSGLVSQLQQDDTYDYKHPEKLLKQIGLSANEEDTLTGPMAQDLKEHMAKKQEVSIYDIDLKLEHIHDVEVNYDYLESLLADLANYVHDHAQAKAELTYQETKKLSAQMDDRKHAGEIDRTAIGLLKGDLIADHYPVESKDVKNLIEQHNQVTKKAEIAAFMRKWGLLDVQVSEIAKLLNRHVHGQDDFDRDGALSRIMKVAQENYRDYAADETVKRLTKIRYRNQLREAFAKFSDQMIETYN